MSKRAFYSIPLTGLALTSVGCPQDPPPPGVDVIFTTFSADAINGLVVPYTDTDKDVSVAQDGSLLCDVTYEITNLTVADNLTGSMVYSTTYANCVDTAAAPATPPTDIIVNYDATIIIVVANTNYLIVLANDAGATVNLDCNFSNGLLDCVDDAGIGWAFTEL